jgi:flagellar basal body rod protein FlgG
MAASGLRARMESLDLLANNVANSSTGGFKADREFYSVYVSAEAAENDAAGVMPVIAKPWTDFAPGTLYSTGNSLDVALSGSGFFAVDGPSGPLFTRNGSFQMKADGTLVTADGYPVRGLGGAGIRLAAARPVEIAGDGSIRQDSAVAGKLEIVDFTSNAGLSKQGRSYFRAAERPGAAPAVSVEQGKLEASNTGGAESAVRLVSVMRQFEMLQRAATLGAEMNRQAVEQVAKVGQ